MFCNQESDLNLCFGPLGKTFCIYLYIYVYISWVLFQNEWLCCWVKFILACASDAGSVKGVIELVLGVAVAPWVVRQARLLGMYGKPA